MQKRRIKKKGGGQNQFVMLPCSWQRLALVFCLYIIVVYKLNTLRAKVRDDQLFYVERSRKFTNRGSTSRWLFGQQAPISKNTLLDLPLMPSMTKFVRQHQSGAREVIVAAEELHIRKAYVTKRCGDILSLEDQGDEVKTHTYTPSSEIDIGRYFEISPQLQQLSGRWGHIRRNQEGVVDAVYVSVLSEQRTPSYFSEVVAQSIGRDWTAAELEWWRSVAASVVSFVGIGSDHVTLYYDLERREYYPSDELKKHVGRVKRSWSLWKRGSVKGRENSVTQTRKCAAGG